MNNISFKKFEVEYEALSSDYKQILWSLLKNMEHNKDNPSDVIDYSNGIKIALSENEMSRNDLIKEVEKLTGQKYLKSSINSVIDKDYKNSVYLKPILDVLGIDDDYLITHSEYFSSQHRQTLEWLFNSLSNQNKYAIYMHTMQLKEIEGGTYKAFLPTHLSNENVGIATEY